MRRVAVFFVSSVAVSAAVAAACGFPSVDFDERRGEDAGDPDLSGDAGAPSDADTTPSTPPPIDATSDKPDTGPCEDPCDCDKDGHRSKDGGCGGDDCDDNDPRAYPGQNFLTEIVTNDTKGDWNCDGVVERYIKNVNVTCSGAFACPANEGLRSDIPCGAYGEYLHCGVRFLACTTIDSGYLYQECR